MPRKNPGISAHTAGQVISFSTNLGSKAVSITHRHESARETTGIHGHLPAWVDLLPVFGEREAIISAGRPHLPTRGGDIGSSAPKEANSKCGHQNGCGNLATSSLIINLDQGQSSWCGKDSFKVGDDERQGNSKREG